MPTALALTPAATTVIGVHIAPVSVVIPCYRCAKTVGRAVDSVTRQTVRPLELILIEDASGDDTLETLLQLQREHGEDWVKIIPLEVNVGPGTARNMGWDAARGKFLAFLDADDTWHPRKIELQYAYMQSRPDVALSGHGVVQHEDTEVAQDYAAPLHYRIVGVWRLILSNPFVTPSAMVRRSLHYRFAAGRRFMEDHRLWMQIACGGHTVAYLDANLAFIYKAPFGESGLSSRLIDMEKGELANYAWLFHAGHVGPFASAGLLVFSLAKFFRRLFLLFLRWILPTQLLSNRDGFNYLFPAVYAFNGLSITALLVGFGLGGLSYAAADVGIVQGAAIATFYAFSGNTRNILLDPAQRVSLNSILEMRLLLAVPLSVLTLWLSVVIAGVDYLLAGIIVLRRVVEWITDLHLCEIELKCDADAGRLHLVLQAVVLTVAIAANLADGEVNIAALLAWALLPLAASARFLVLHLALPTRLTRDPFSVFLPHLGSTVAVGSAIYVLRLFVLMLAGKAVTGALFTAYSIGSFMASVFANVLGPSVARHEALRGQRFFPRPLRIASLSMAGIGTVVLAVAITRPNSLSWMNLLPEFWLGLGFSLLGGVLMLAAQRRRLEAIGFSAGDRVFAPDTLAHIVLIGAIPLLYMLGATRGLALIYLLNAALCYFFYATAEKGLFGNMLERKHVEGPLRAGLVLLLVLPLFVQLSGRIYHQDIPMIDSGGIIANLPIPVSFAACFGGIVLLGDYRRASLSLAVILGLFTLMVIAAVISSGGNVVSEKPKLLLLLQFILPLFGLVLGQLFGAERNEIERIGRVLFWVLAVTVPAQLILGWKAGYITLWHDLGFFSVYQHLQFVPVVFVICYFVAFDALWQDRRYRPWLLGYLPVMGLYAVASTSLLPIFLLVLGVRFVYSRHLRLSKGRAEKAALVILLVVAGAYLAAMMAAPVDHGPRAGAFVVTHDFTEKLFSMDKGSVRLPVNVQRRLDDWSYYAAGIGETYATFLFGQPHPPDRQKTTSAHNYYLDFIYNFGLIALTPLVVLIGFTVRQVYLRRSVLLAEPGLAALALGALLLIFVDNSLKVTLRQPYPGIITCFFWGVLLSWIQTRQAAHGRPFTVDGNGLRPADSAEDGSGTGLHVQSAFR